MSNKVRFKMPVAMTVYDKSKEIVFDNIKDFVAFKKAMDDKLKTLNFIELDPSGIQIDNDIIVVNKSKIDLDKPPSIILVENKSYVVVEIYKTIFSDKVLVRVYE